MLKDEIELTIEQQELLYLISKMTDSINCPISWIKQTPLQALVFQAIRKGLFNEYDYAPISTSFLGQGRKFVNISKEGEDDLGDLREFGLLETIRLSSTKHDYITGYRPTKESFNYLARMDKEIRQRVDDLFICPTCKKDDFKLEIKVEESEFHMKCNNCSYSEDIPLVVPEDVSYSTKAYFFSSLKKKTLEGEKQ
ncbi:MAG: hypothetical protein JXA54_14275 [Candidatus Heimdallarchaeota archaeon]|nr:hypothetical protein [Candidatus Heimdallarchaeota archaeon]